MNQRATFGINTWGFGQLFNYSIFVEAWTVIKLAHSTGGEANMGHIRDHTATEESFLA